MSAASPESAASPDAAASLAATYELAPQPPSGEGFETAWPVRAGDVDTANRLRYDSVARYLQDIGSDNLDASGLGDTDPFWIVRRTVIDVVRPSVWPRPDASRLSEPMSWRYRATESYRSRLAVSTSPARTGHPVSNPSPDGGCGASS